MYGSIFRLLVPLAMALAIASVTTLLVLRRRAAPGWRPLPFVAITNCFIGSMVALLMTVHCVAVALVWLGSREGCWRASRRLPRHPVGFPDLQPAVIRRDWCSLRDRLRGRGDWTRELPAGSAPRRRARFARHDRTLRTCNSASALRYSGRSRGPLQSGRPHHVRLGTPIAGPGAPDSGSEWQHPSRSRGQSGLPDLNRTHRSVY